ncbi:MULTISPECIES: TrmH family RNA methyltransferase [Bacillus]|uniref:TrmH family RNA methyltransferase n=1 Tax=Bacillus TaxID=1386 RepID=UPI0002DFAE4C|nr:MULTISPECIES: RNA methyltransferase [Bacillus]
MKFIQSIQNERVKAWKKLLTKKGRDKAGLFLVEGFHLVEEALKQDFVLTLIKDEKIEFPINWNVDGIEIYNTTASVVKELAETETSQAVFAVCKQKKYEEKKYQKLLLLDGVQDPGNMGTIIRTADAAGVEIVVCGEGCVDIYNSKSLRSTQGSIFHLPIVKANLTEYIHGLQDKNIPVFGTSLSNAIDYREVETKECFALVMGNEGNGVREEILNQCTQNLYIPIYGGAESLNVTVATGILLYHLNK